MKNISDEEMDELMNMVKDGLGDVLKGIADVKCIKGDTNKIMGRMMQTYMEYPIVKIIASRSGSDVSVNLCNVDDVVEILPNVIGNLLSLIPDSERNNVLYKAITNTDMTDNGKLLDELNNSDEEDEEDD